MEISSPRFFQMVRGVLVLCQLERALPGRHKSSGAGIKKIQVDTARARLGRDAQPTLLILDAQSVKNTNTAALKGY